MGNDESHFLQTFKWGSSYLVKPMLQLAQQRHPSTTATLTANPNNSSIQNVTSKQTSLNHQSLSLVHQSPRQLLSRTLMTTVQHQDFPVTQTVTQSTVGPGQQTHGTHGNLPTVFARAQKIATCTSSAVQQRDFGMQSSPQRGSAQLIVPAAVLQQNGNFNLNQDAVKDPEKLFQHWKVAMQHGVSLPVAKQVIFNLQPAVGPDEQVQRGFRQQIVPQGISLPAATQGPQQVLVQSVRKDHSKVPPVGSGVQLQV